MVSCNDNPIRAFKDISTIGDVSLTSSLWSASSVPPASSSNNCGVSVGGMGMSRRLKSGNPGGVRPNKDDVIDIFALRDGVA
ncbi:hypothetical protein QYF36_003003 [Acer negundo]|nr:hypothetical protein QYF36_003003 [Acer negundo]